MSKTYTLKITTPDKELFHGEVVKTAITTTDGGLEIHAHHMPIAVITIPSRTEFLDDQGNKKVVFTSNGVVTFNNNVLTFCCDAGDWPEEIDIARAERAKNRAENRLKDQSKYDERRAKLALSRALARIDVKTN